MLEKWYEDSVETVKHLLASLLWSVIVMMLPVILAHHFHRVYGMMDSLLIPCIIYWWYMVVSGSDRVNGWLEVKLNLKERRTHG